MAINLILIDKHMWVGGGIYDHVGDIKIIILIMNKMFFNDAVTF